MDRNKGSWMDWALAELSLCKNLVNKGLRSSALVGDTENTGLTARVVETYRTFKNFVGLKLFEIPLERCAMHHHICPPIRAGRIKLGGAEFVIFEH